MRRRSVTRAFPALLVAALACQAAPSELTDADRAAIDAMHTEFQELVRAGNFAAVAPLYTDNARFMPPNAPTVQGPAAIQQWMEALPPITQFSTTNVEVGGQGDMAYVIGSYVMQVEGYPADSGKYVEVLVRGADGAWRLSADMFNSDLPIPGM